MGRGARLTVRPIAARFGPWSVVGVLAVLVLGPLVALQWRAIADGAHGYRGLFADDHLAETIGVTVGLAAGSVLIAVTLGVGLAWASHGLRGRWRVLGGLTVLPIVVPPLATVTGWSFLLTPRIGYLNQLLRNVPWWSDLDEGPIDIFTVPWIVVITGLVLVPFVYAFVLTGLRGIDPSLLAAARVCGSRPGAVFFRVVLPLIRPQIFYGAAIVLLLGLGQFTAPLLLGRQEGIAVLSTEMYRISREGVGDYGIAAAYGSPLILSGVLVLLAQGRLVGDLRNFASNQGSRDLEPRRRQLIPVLALGTFFTVAVLLPLGALAIVAGSPFWSGKIDFGALTLENIRTMVSNDLTRESIATSVRLSVISVGLALPLCYVAASILAGVTRAPRGVRRAVDVLVNVPLAVPGVLFGAGVLFAATSGPISLYGSPWLIVIAYVIVVVPHVARLLLGRMVSLGRSYPEASRMCGAGPLRTHLRVILPLVRGGVAIAAAMGIALLTHEFSASLMVRTTRTQVMGTLLYDQWTRALYPNVAAVALIMCAVSATTVLVVWALGGRRKWESA